MIVDNEKSFWEYLEKLVLTSEIVIDRPKGTRHPKYQNMIYVVDYGFLKNTKSMDGNEIDIFVGSDNNKKIDSILCIIDLIKKDSEIKILIGCTENEKNEIYQFMNNSDYMKAILVKREENE